MKTALVTIALLGLGILGIVQIVHDQRETAAIMRRTAW